MLVGRLLLFAALLFVMAAIAAAIAPAPKDDSSKRADTPPPAASTGPPAETIRQELPDADGNAVTIHPSAGDIVELRVISDEIDDVVIEDLGVLEPVDENSPAILNFIVDEPGTYEVRLDHQEKLVGRLVVGPPRSKPAPGGSSGPVEATTS